MGGLAAYDDRDEILSPLPKYVARAAGVLAANASSLYTFLVTEDVSLISLAIGGRGPCQASFFRVNSSTTELVPGGGFNSSADVALWTNAGVGGSAGLIWTYTTAQSFEGTGSAVTAFTTSDNDDYPAIKYTWSTPKDVVNWRYITASARVTVAGGGAQTRTISIILTDINGATRTYSVAGTTTTAPFSTEQWVTITGEIRSPTSETGTFDPFNVSSITLKLQDGGNKTGTIYWDNVRFSTEQVLIDRLYSLGETEQITLDPTEVFLATETLGILIRNNDTVSREIVATARGIKRDP